MTKPLKLVDRGEGALRGGGTLQAWDRDAEESLGLNRRPNVLWNQEGPAAGLHQPCVCWKNE